MMDRVLGDVVLLINVSLLAIVLLDQYAKLDNVQLKHASIHQLVLLIVFVLMVLVKALVVLTALNVPEDVITMFATIKTKHVLQLMIVLEEHYLASIQYVSLILMYHNALVDGSCRKDFASLIQLMENVDLNN